MKKVRVEIPFRMSVTNRDHIPGDIIEVTEDTLSKIREINVNMVSVIGDAETAGEKPRAEKKPRVKADK